MGLFGFLTKRSAKKRHKKSLEKLQGEQAPPPPEDVLPQDPLQDNLAPPPQDQAYAKSGVLGKGAFGRVDKYSAPGKRDVVKKVALSEDTQTELDNESKVLDTLGEHENIVKKSDEDLGGGGLGLEMLKGGNVGDMMESLEEDYRKGKISHSQYHGSLQYLTKGMLGGLGHMHDKNLVHGDVKPENAMIDEETLQPKLIDFGSTRTEGGEMGNPSPGYVAPEVIGGGDKSAKSSQDIYAIGSMNFRFGEGRKKEEGQLPGYSHARRTDNPQAMLIDRYSAKRDKTDALPEPGKTDEGKQKYGHGSYGEFVNALTNTNPENRPGAKDSLEAPYLQDPLMQDEEAQGFLKSRLQQKGSIPTPPPAPAPELAPITATKDDHKAKSDMQKELLKKTKGTRKELDTEAKVRQKDPEIKKQVKALKKKKKEALTDDAPPPPTD